MRRARWPAATLVWAAAVFLGAAILTIYLSFPAAAHREGIAGAAPGWLMRLNMHRAAAKLPLIAEVNETWNDGCEMHAIYMVKNHAIGHSEIPANEWYSPEGHACAKSSNVLGSFLPTSDEEAIDTWMEAPFHAVGMLDPRLEESGFGSYREDTNMFPEMSAALDVWRGLGPVPASVSFPIMWPGDGESTPLTEYPGNEGPDPLTSCPGYDDPTGLPLILQVGTGNVNPVVTAHSFMQGAEALESCVFSEMDYSNPISGNQTLGRLILGGRDAIILIPRNPLILGNEYTASITANGDTHTWTFTVTDVAPPPGTPTNTATNAPPASTPTNTTTPAAPTSTFTATNTPPIGGSTSTPTDTRIPTNTPNASATQAPPTDTPTNTLVPAETPTPTATAIGATVTPTETPTSTPTFTPTRTATPTATSMPSVQPGDGNCDGLVNSLDALGILQMSAGLLAGLPCGHVADVDRSARTDVLDAALILQYNAGLIPDLSGRAVSIARERAFESTKRSRLQYVLTLR